MNVCKSLLRVATQKNPNRIPEWEQRLRRSRTRDEGKPSGFSLINSVSALDHVAFHQHDRLGYCVEQGRLGLADRELELAQQRIQRLHRLDRVADVDVRGQR